MYHLSPLYVIDYAGSISIDEAARHVSLKSPAFQAAIQKGDR